MAIPCLLNNPTVSVSVDPDALAFIIAAGITDLAQQIAVNQLVVGLKGANLWTKMLAVYPFIGATATAHKFNLKDPQNTDGAKRLTFNGAWTHSANGSIPTVADGTAFARTHIVQNELAQDDNHASIYVRTDIVAGNTIDLGTFTPGNDFMISAYYAVFGGAFARNNNGAQSVVNVRANSLGHFINTRVSAILTTIYAAGLPANTSAVASALPSAATEYAIGGAMHAGNASVQDGASREFAFVSFGESLVDAEALALYNLVQDVQTLLGRNV